MSREKASSPLRALERKFAKLSGGTAATTSDKTDRVVAEMRHNRRVNQKTANNNNSAVNMSFATGRPRDPLFYWRQNNLPYDFTNPDELVKIREYARLLYLTHPIVASCVDIFAKYPILGLEISCKDEKVADFYRELFLSEDHLDYEKFLIDLGREYWLVGEAFPFGTFNESLGIWESEELLDPNGIEVQKSPFLRDPRFFMRLPESIRNVIQKREPRWEYEKLIAEYPHLLNYSRDEARMPVSNVLLKHLRFTADTFNPRGVPLMMRAMRAIIQEEMLNAAMDSIADRLYTPLILVRIGLTAAETGKSEPWIPTPDDIANFEEALDTALAADFRAIIHHMGVQIDSVFGREQMPDLTPDFERLEERILQSFGLSKTLLSGAGEGETYAADALNKNLVTQLLTTYQKMLKSHFRSRALVVAEAQEHYDYEVRNGKRYVIMEEVLEVDEETGEERIVEQPKLLVPELRFKTMDLKDEQQEHDFMEALRAAGVPISMKTRLQNIPIDFEEQIEQSKAEAVRLAVAEQETRKDIYRQLKSDGLPIPDDLKQDFEPRAQPESPEAVATMARVPMMGTDEVAYNPNLIPTAETDAAIEVDAEQPSMVADQEEGDAFRPEESDEMRDGMPTVGSLFAQANKINDVAKRYAPKLAKPMDSMDAEEKAEYLKYTPQGQFSAPSHLGVRKKLGIDPTQPLKDQEDNDA